MRRRHKLRQPASGDDNGESGVNGVTQELLDSLNEPQHAEENTAALKAIGGVEALLSRLNVDAAAGLSDEQYQTHVQAFGTNDFPEKPMKSFVELFFNAFKDFTLVVLTIAAVVSLALGIFVEDHHENGWIEGTAILGTIVIVATVAAANDYTNELQFRELEKSSQADEECTVLRGGAKRLVNPSALTVGDIVVLQAGDGIPADGIIVDNGAVTSNESTLTGESEPRKKTKLSDPFLLSSCTITEAEEARMLVIGIGNSSQWGRIRANLMEEPGQTPLQAKLEEVAKSIGYLGAFAAGITFLVMMVYIFVNREPVLESVVAAFVLAVTIVVVAIPEGLPLAVTISLAYSTRRMYKDNNLVRVLSACETMGNATDICSDKTGTLTTNQMTVVEGWLADRPIPDMRDTSAVPAIVQRIVGEHVCLNRVAYFVDVDSSGRPLPKPEIVGNVTEGALMAMAKLWGYDYREVQPAMFDNSRDKIFAFQSTKKRSTAVVHLADGTVRVYCKGAAEYVLQDCSQYLRVDGSYAELTDAKRREISDSIVDMAGRALRTICVAHRDFASVDQLPPDWRDVPPDSSNLVCAAIVGIIDPLREGVTEAVALAQQAGITVRMVTGDNINTACAIARECGILTEGGIALEGPAFRNMTPLEVDRILPKLQVLARSSPEDKLLLVTRLNGVGLPVDKEEWESKHPGYSWEKDRDLLLPGYKDEWEASRPHGGQVVGVTGDGTNDAPALKAADVGLSMGVTGTRVAKDASDIVILDDNFSSIVRAIMWGRSVYDNVRKFIQFQLSVNVVACTVVFIAAVAGLKHPPLNAVMMLWVNLIMDSLGALALGTEAPTAELLNRKPYKRSSALVNRPMGRHIIAQSIFQLVLMMILLFAGPSLFGVDRNSTVHNTIVFNAFVFCQIFNEFNCLSLTDKWNVYERLGSNTIFGAIIFVTILIQVLIVQFGGVFTRTAPLNGIQWVITVLLGAIALPVGVAMRFIPAPENPETYFDNVLDWQRFLSARGVDVSKSTDSSSFNKAAPAGQMGHLQIEASQV